MKMRQRRARFVRDPIRSYRYGTLAYHLSAFYPYQREAMRSIAELAYRPIVTSWFATFDPVPDVAIQLMREREVQFINPLKDEHEHQSATMFMQNSIKQISDAVGIPEHMLTAKGLK